MSRNKRVVVAMSGGVDSSVAAALLVEQGYEVIGMMLRLWADPTVGEGAENRCCSLEAVDDARRVAARLDIPFYLVNAEDEFKSRVVDFFIREYAAGRTPNPCLNCNRHVRWQFLLNRALTLDATHLATGHYARVEWNAASGQYLLRKAIDPQKDQSYVLHVLGQHELAHALFPLGGYTKSEVRQMARERGLPVAEKAESQELCFLADNDYRRFLRTYASDALTPGAILDTGGRVQGQHQGLPLYTIGQRKGLGIAVGEPRYVVQLDGERNALIVGPEQALERRTLTARNVNWMAGAAPPEPIRVEVKIRYRAVPAAAVVTPLPGGRTQVEFDMPQRAVTPGQAAVFYRGDVCLGGGIIQQ